MKEMIARVGDSINKDGIVSVCLTGEELVRCRDCKYAHLTNDGECKYCDMEADDEGNIPERYRPWDWYCADGEGIKNENIDRKATAESSEATCCDPAHRNASDIRG